MFFIEYITFSTPVCISPLFAMRIQFVLDADMLAYVIYKLSINPLRAKFVRGNINIYLHFVSFLHIDTT